MSSARVEPKKKVTLIQEIPLHQHVEFPGLLRVELVRLIHSVAQGVFIWEMRIQNLSGKTLNSNEVKFMIQSKGKPAPLQQAAIKQDSIPPAVTADARAVARAERLEDTELTVSIQGKTARAVFGKQRFK